MNAPKKLPLTLWVLISFLLSSAVCVLLYFHNNKYTVPAAQPRNGFLDLTQETASEASSLRFLRDGWAFYPDVLLGPADFNDGAPQRYMVYTSIGDFTRFSRAESPDLPYGCGTWTLDLWLPEGTEYVLELPEVFSACRLYVNGQLALQTGDPDPEHYVPRTSIRTVPLNASGHVRLILAVSNYSHFYSGIVYPPAFGSLQAVSQYRLTQSLYTASWVIFALILSGIMLGAALRMRHRNALLFIFLCLSMIGFTSHPLIHLLELPVFPWYALEIFCGYLLAFLAVTIQNRICMPPRICVRISQGTTLGFSLLALAYGLSSSHLTVSMIRLFSGGAATIKFLTAGYLLAVSFLGILRRQPESRILLCGNAAYSAFFLWDRLLPVYEPIYGGWFLENGSQILVVFLFWALAWDILQAYSFHLSFAEEYRQLSRQLSIQQEHYRELTDRVEESIRLRHDARHHFTTISALLDQGRLDQLRAYLAEYQTEQIPQNRTVLCRCLTVDAILQYYRKLCAENGIRFAVQADLPPDLPFSDTDLTILFGNLVENACEACLSPDVPSPSVLLKTAYTEEGLYLRVENTYTNPIRTAHNGRYLSTKHSGVGIGTESVRAVTTRLDGQIRFQTQAGKFQVSVILPAPVSAG